MGLLDDLYATQMGAFNDVPNTTKANVNRLTGLLGFDSTGNGLLSDLQYGARNALSKAKWNAGNRMEAIQRYMTDPEYRNRPEVRQALSDAVEQWGDAIAPGAMAGAIKASHGSPHLFDRFDFSKIGSGEGAQAYGHGGYFAQGFDSPVAKKYAEELANINQNTGYSTAHLNAQHQVKRFGNDPEWAAEVVSDTMRNFDPKDPQYASLADTLKLIQSGDYAKPLTTEGNLYNVELRWPDAAREAADPLSEHHLLDWDAPLSEQPEIAKKLGFSTRTKDQIHDEYDALVAKHGYYHEMPPEIQTRVQQLQDELNNQIPNLTGEQFYSGNTENDYLHSRLSGKGFTKEQSDYLRDLGIPGIRYLDAGSRSAGNGSRNYVIFDDSIPKIITRNGKSLLED